MRFAVLALAVGALAACQSSSDDAAGSSCRLQDYARLQNRLSADITPAELPPGARIICHNCAYTEDHRPARLNLWLDADGRVARLNCG